MAWTSLVVAGLFEVFGVTMINKLHKDRSWQALSLLVLGFGASFFFLAYAWKPCLWELLMLFGPVSVLLAVQ